MIADLEAYLRNPLGEVRSGDVGWCYRRCGDAGPAVLLLPGFVGGGDAWFPLVVALQGSFRFLVPDYAAVSTARELERGLLAILDAENVDGFHLAGQSFGGLLAQWLVRRHRDRVRSLVLCHAGPPRADELPSLRWRIALGSILPMFMHRLQWRRRIAAERRGDDPESHFWRTFFLERIERLPRGELLGLGRCYRDLLRHCAFSPDDLDDWNGHTLIVESDDDPVIGAAERAAVRAFHPAARVLRFEDAGHTSLTCRAREVASAFAHVAGT